MQLSNVLITVGLGAVLIGVLSACVPTRLVSSQPRKTVPLLIDQKEYQVELAETPSQQQMGLSGRSQIGSDGMLFVFSKPAVHGFWMKDMQFDLDFIWIRNNEVVEITRNVLKPTANQQLRDLPNYYPKQPIDMMLEVTVGFADEKNISVGSSVELKKEE